MESKGVASQTWFWFLIIGLILLILYAITKNLLILLVGIGFIILAGVFMIKNNSV